MKPSPKMIGLLSALVLASAAPALAAPLPDRDGPPPAMRDHGPERHGGPGARGGGDIRPGRDGMRGLAGRGLELAAKLSAAETYVGISADQQDAWRAYASALIGFFDRPAPTPTGGPDAARP